MGIVEKMIAYKLGKQSGGNGNVAIDGGVIVTDDGEGNLTVVNSGGGDITVEPLSVSENGTYTAETGKAYNPVTVNVGVGFDIIKYCTRMYNTFYQSALPELVDIDFSASTQTIVSLQGMFGGATGVKHIIIRNFTTSATNLTMYETFLNANAVEQIDFINCNFSPMSFQGTFNNQKIKIITGELDFTNTTSIAYFLTTAGTLEEIRFKPNTLKISIETLSRFNMCSKLSDESLVSIGNGLNDSVTDKSVLLHADKKARCGTLMGRNDNGTFVADAQGTMSLETFITTVKGWTLA